LALNSEKWNLNSTITKSIQGMALWLTLSNNMKERLQAFAGWIERTGFGFRLAIDKNVLSDKKQL